MFVVLFDQLLYSQLFEHGWYDLLNHGGDTVPGPLDVPQNSCWPENLPCRSILCPCTESRNSVFTFCVLIVLDLGSIFND
jgi:hypothetical protein